MLTLLLLVGCGPRPTDGVYQVEVQNLDADVACETRWLVDLEDYEEIDVTFVEVSKDRKTMQLDGNLGCEFDGLSFDCSLLTQDSTEGYDMDSENLTEVAGEWTSSVNFESNWSLLATCTGADCGSYSESCTITWTMAAELDRKATKERDALIRAFSAL